VVNVSYHGNLLERRSSVPTVAVLFQLLSLEITPHWYVTPHVIGFKSRVHAIVEA